MKKILTTGIVGLGLLSASVVKAQNDINKQITHEIEKLLELKDGEVIVQQKLHFVCGDVDESVSIINDPCSGMILRVILDPRFQNNQDRLERNLRKLKEFNKTKDMRKSQNMKKADGIENGIKTDTYNNCPEM